MLEQSISCSHLLDLVTKASPLASLCFIFFIKFIKTSQIILSYGTGCAWSIHYGFLSWQAIWIERQLVHYAHMKPITPPAMANSSNIYLLPSEQCVNLLVNPQPWLLWKMGEKLLFFSPFSLNSSSRNGLYSTHSTGLLLPLLCAKGEGSGYCLNCRVTDWSKIQLSLWHCLCAWICSYFHYNTVFRRFINSFST